MDTCVLDTGGCCKIIRLREIVASTLDTGHWTQAGALDTFTLDIVAAKCWRVVLAVDKQ